MKIKNKMFRYEIYKSDDNDYTMQYYVRMDSDNYLIFSKSFGIVPEVPDNLSYSGQWEKIREKRKKIAQKLGIPLIRKYDVNKGSNYYNRDIILESYDISYCSKSTSVKYQDNLTSIQKLDAVDYRMTTDIEEYFRVYARYLFANGINTHIEYIIHENDVKNKKFYNHLMSKTRESVVAPTINYLRGFRGYDKEFGKPDPSGDDKWWT